MEDQDPSLEEVEVKVDAETHLVQREGAETFWELYSKLGDCYRTDMARLTHSGEGPAQSSILGSGSEYVGGLKSPIFFSGASDDTVAKSQGLRLQQARCEPDGARILKPAPEAPSLHESSHHSQGAQDAHFDLRACWLDRAGTSPQTTELQRRRMSLTSVDVCRESVTQLLASQPRFLVFSPHENFRRAWDVLFAGCVVFELILNPLHAFDNAWSLEPFARSSWSALELVLHVFWNLDLLVTMRTAVFCSGYLDFRLMQHVMACAWYYVGSTDPVDGWVARSVTHSGTMGYRYTASLYWMLCCFGFGTTEAEPVTQLEILFGIMAAMVGLAIFSLLLGAITTNCAILSRAADDHRQQFRQLRRFLAYTNVDADLRVRITHFLERAYVLNREDRPESEVPLLALLSKPLQRELQFARYEGCLREVGFSKYLASVSGHHPAELLVLQHLATHAISQAIVPAGDAVFESGTLARAAYFLLSGRFGYSVDRLDVSVETERWVSEMTLWTPWLHSGNLTTKEESSVVTLLEKEFSSCMQRFWDFYTLARTYASEYVGAMSEQIIVTDLWEYRLSDSDTEEQPPPRSSTIARRMLNRIVNGTRESDKVVPAS